MARKVQNVEDRMEGMDPERVGGTHKQASAPV